MKGIFNTFVRLQKLDDEESSKMVAYKLKEVMQNETDFFFYRCACC